MRDDSTMVSAERDELLTTTQVARMLFVDRTTVWRWAVEGELPCYRLGGGKTIRIPRRAVMELLQRCAIKGE